MASCCEGSPCGRAFTPSASSVFLGARSIPTSAPRSASGKSGANDNAGHCLPGTGVLPGGIRSVMVIARPAISTKRPAKIIRNNFLNVMSISLILELENQREDYGSNCTLHFDGEYATPYQCGQIHRHTKRLQKRHVAGPHARQSLD